MPLCTSSSDDQAAAIDEHVVLVAPFHRTLILEAAGDASQDRLTTWRCPRHERPCGKKDIFARPVCVLRRNKQCVDRLCELCCVGWQLKGCEGREQAHVGSKNLLTFHGDEHLSAMCWKASATVVVPSKPHRFGRIKSMRTDASRMTGSAIVAQAPSRCCAVKWQFY